MQTNNGRYHYYLNNIYSLNKAIYFDKNNNIVLDLTQLNDKERSYIGFKNNNPNVEITKISFINEINKQAYVVPEIFIGEPKSDRLGDGV